MNNNGDLSFNNGFSDFSPDPFPISTPLIAPFWTDLYTGHFGSLWYRVTTDSDVIQRIREEVTSAFPELTTFSASEVLIATWDHVGYCCSSNSPVRLYKYVVLQLYINLPICLYAYMPIFHNPNCLYADLI